MLTQSHSMTKSRGFLLLEILLALFIFVLGSASIWALWTASLETHKQALAEQGIAMLAESLVAEIQDVYLRQGMPLPSIRNVASKNFPGYQYDVVFTDVGEDAILLTIHVRYNRYGRPQQETMHTVLYRQMAKVVNQK